MRLLSLALAASLLPSVAAAGEPPCDGGACPPYAYPKLARTLVGFGGVPGLRSASATLTAEIGGRPFSGAPPDIGAFSTGFAISSTTDLTGRFTVVTPGIFVKMDLTCIFLGGLWVEPPPRLFPFRLQLGGRVGIGLSDSFRSVPNAPSYALLRPELQSFLDLELPVDRWRVYSIVVRGAVDKAVSSGDPFRWSASVGLDYGWDNG